MASPYSARPTVAVAKAATEQNRATIIIDVPQQARLYIDGQLMANKFGKRTFATTPLQPGQAYFHDVRMEWVENGQQQVQSTRVVFRSGETVAATFNSSPSGTALVSTAAAR
jgi:uncharacterized protein (TIGR03000 family)